MDIAYEVSCLSRYLVAPRTGHLIQAFHIFKYLELHSTNSLVFDARKLSLGNPTDLPLDMHISNMRRVYPDANKDIPPNTPETRGASVQLNCFVDASHGSDKATRRSQTGVLIFINRAPIISISRSIFLSLYLNTFRVLDWTVSNSHILLQN